MTLRLLRTSCGLALLLVAVRVPTAPAQQGGGGMPDELRRITLLYDEFKDEEAYAACNEYLVAHPLMPGVVEARARCLLNLGRFDEAVQALRMLPQQSSRTKLLLADCLARTKAGGPEAEQLVNEVAADDPNGIDPRITRARVFISLNKYNEAAAEIRYVLSTTPKNFEANLLGAMLTEANGQFDRALGMYIPLVQKPTDYEVTDHHHERDAVVQLAGVYVKMQMYDEAISMYRQIVEKMPGNPDYLLSLGICLAVQDRFTEAISTLEKGIALAPQHAELRWRLGDIYRSQSKTDEAIAEFEALLALHNPKFQVIAERKLCDLYLDKGLLDKAKLHIDTAMTIAPDSPDILEANGRVREKLSDIAGAKDSYRKAFEKNPLKFDALYKLGLLLVRSDDPAEKQEGERFLGRHKRIEKFLRDLERNKQEIAINPTSPVLMTRQAALLNLAGEYDTARTWAESSFKLSSRNASTCVQLGYICANLKDFPNALKYFQLARKLVPTNDKAGLREYITKLDGYIQKLMAGEPLPLPLGEDYQPVQKKPEAAPVGGR